jgi:hypothetical protein
LPAEDHVGMDATNVVELDEEPPLERKTWSDAELRPLATMAGRRKQPITTNPPLIHLLLKSEQIAGVGFSV